MPHFRPRPTPSASLRLCRGMFPASSSASSTGAPFSSLLVLRVTLVDSALRLFSIRLFENSPLDARLRIGRFLHLMIDLVEAARGDEFGDHRGRGVIGDLRKARSEERRVGKECRSR